MDNAFEFLILAVALIILAAVAWLELRYVKNKRGGQAEASLVQDEAYNAVTTTKAVAESLRQQGRDTTEAEIVLYQAESAYERRQYGEAKEMADRAKSALRHAPQRELVTCPVPPPAAPQETAEDAEAERPASTEVPSVAVKKLPANYLESKFIIESARCLLDDAPEERRAPAALLLTEARQCFDEADYTNALRLAMKAKRGLEGAGAKSAPPSPPAAEAETVPEQSCPTCGAEMDAGDQFCHACGGRKAATCPTCSAELKDGDQFCRGCGGRV